jgi:hypothetical protein
MLNTAKICAKIIVGVLVFYAILMSYLIIGEDKKIETTNHVLNGLLKVVPGK